MQIRAPASKRRLPPRAFRYSPEVTAATLSTCRLMPSRARSGKQSGLPARDEPADSSGALCRLGSGEGQDPVADVRIALLVIGNFRDANSLSTTCRQAQPDEHVAQHPTEGVVPPAPGEDRLVPRVVAEDQLTPHQSEDDCVDQLIPRVTHPDDREAGRRVGPQCQRSANPCTRPGGARTTQRCERP